MEAVSTLATRLYTYLCYFNWALRHNNVNSKSATGESIFFLLVVHFCCWLYELCGCQMSRVCVCFDIFFSVWQASMLKTYLASCLMRRTLSTSEQILFKTELIGLLSKSPSWIQQWKRVGDCTEPLY